MTLSHDERVALRAEIDRRRRTEVIRVAETVKKGPGRKASTEPLGKRDYAHARLLLLWSRTIEDHNLSFEPWLAQYA